MQPKQTKGKDLCVQTGFGEPREGIVLFQHADRGEGADQNQGHGNQQPKSGAVHAKSRIDDWAFQVKNAAMSNSLCYVTAAALVFA